MNCNHAIQYLIFISQPEMQRLSSVTSHYCSGHLFNNIHYKMSTPVTLLDNSLFTITQILSSHKGFPWKHTHTNIHTQHTHTHTHTHSHKTHTHSFNKNTSDKFGERKRVAKVT